ncbi:hypothetical protein [Arthrobacter sp. NIO-1057]|uniref:hypothetical protein n=1 Tax=Arthrobacter sp. NIO-1057 TaxID=993071 RepID=UPI000729CD54|nr:hypothetical protein [Arthrobacter sp. NIO-1057]KSU65907.1 hypothetical protein AS038_09430 [Arthrobacter sp. NIO-1057]
MIDKQVEELFEKACFAYSRCITTTRQLIGERTRQCSTDRDRKFCRSTDHSSLGVGKSGERICFNNVAQKLGISQPAAYWSPCGVFDKNEKLVRTFKRQAVKGVSGGTAHLRCGWNKVIDGKNKGQGYRHIKAGHMNDWNNQATYLGANWRKFAD